MDLIAASTETFVKGIAVTVASVVLFVGSVYVLLSAVFGRRMGYLVLAVSLFGWLIILASIWTFPVPGTPRNLGPRGTEPHWQVFAAATRPIETKYPGTAAYPGSPWRPVSRGTRPSADTVTTAIQNYLAQQANKELEGGAAESELAPGAEEPGGEEGFRFSPLMFLVEDVHFTTADDGTNLAAAHAYFSGGGPRLTVFAFHDSGNVPVYSWAFLAASVLGFIIHIPFLDRAERKRKAVLTGGTAPPWYGPA